MFHKKPNVWFVFENVVQVGWWGQVLFWMTVLTGTRFHARMRGILLSWLGLMFFFYFWIWAQADGFIQHRELAFDLDRATHLSFVNPYGGIRVRFHEASTVQIQVTEQSQNPTFNVEKKREGKTWQVKATLLTPNSEIGPKTRMDWTLTLPHSVALDLKTVGDLIEVKGYSLALNCRSVSGDLSLEGTGPTQAETQQGSIFVSLGELQGNNQLVSQNGRIQVLIDPEFKGQIEIRTRQPIATDFSLKISERKGRYRVGKVKQGRGKAHLLIRAENGQVELLAGHSPEAD
ncbi:MAG: hypothetical protein KDC71_15865 [Acidobacteria bacterium]|nr:hypothetical protein [Acidobacteriota bacterium]